jgi:hypothetical protein
MFPPIPLDFVLIQANWNLAQTHDDDSASGDESEFTEALGTAKEQDPSFFPSVAQLVG